MKTEANVLHTVLVSEKFQQHRNTPLEQTRFVKIIMNQLHQI